MARLGGFEGRPRLAVGVSGGADSLALALLAHAWATARGGSVLALTVDHALRAQAAQEAAQVGAWLDGRGIAHA
ncbi:MAG TPA: ATP-binding protein, partial [Azospirillum sp.]